MQTFAGNGFSIAVPDDWVDRSVYSLKGPAEGDFQHVLAIVPDPQARAPSCEDYARRRIRVALASMSGARVLTEGPVNLGGGVRAYRAELRWFPSDQLKLYQRLLYVLEREVGFTLAVQRTKKSRATLGPSIDRMLATFRPLDLPPARGPHPEGSTLLRADRFSLVLYPGWTDETVYSLAQADASRFRRTLVIMREPLDPPPPSIQAVGKDAIEKMKAKIPGFELLEEGELTPRDGAPAYRTWFMRGTQKGGTVMQGQLLALRSGKLFTLTLTVEREPPARKMRVLVEVLPSFEASTAGAPQTVVAP